MSMASRISASTWAWMLGVMFCAGANPGHSEGLPLESERVARFSTDEGTWMSLDVSPDGSTIVFELLGDLYTLPIAGGQATRITHGMAFDAQPRYSPDGATLVFVSDRNGSENLWLADANGGDARELTSERYDMFMSPEWTPDGDGIMVTRSIGGAGGYGWARDSRDLALYVYHLSGGAGVKLSTRPPPAPVGQTPPGQPGCTGAAFGGDPNVLFASFSFSASIAAAYGQSAGIWQIISFDQRTGMPRIRTDEPGGAMRPVVSPDDRYLVYATNRDDVTSLRIRDMRTETTRTLMENVTRDSHRLMDIGRDLMPGAAFTPDGRALIVSSSGKLWRVSVPDGQVTSIPFVADVEQQLGPLLLFDQPIDDDVLEVRQIRDARPSPDGRHLVFSALDRLWLMSLPEGRPQRLTADDIGEYFPVWSPDGRHIAYTTWSERAGGAIKRIRPHLRARPEVLTNSSDYYYEKLAYTPDGKSLLASRSSHQFRAELLGELRTEDSARMLNAMLVRIPLDGSEARVIMPLTAGKETAPSFYGAPHFSRGDGRTYLYEYDEGLVSMDDAGRDRRSILKMSGWRSSGIRQRLAPAEDLLISPDGAQALALANQDLYLIDLPVLSPPQVPELSVGGRQTLPMKRITRQAGAGPAGDFPGWMTDGRLYYSLGRSFFVYDPKSLTTQRTDVDMKVPRDKPSGALLLSGARLVSMQGTEIIEDGDLLVVGNRIAALGPRGQVTVPDNTRIFDVSGKTIIPGLIDVHGHLWPAWGAHRVQPWEFAATLAYGVTTNRDPQTLYMDVLTYGDRLDAGDMIGPRMFATGRGVFEVDTRFQSLGDARDVLRRYSEFYRNHMIKQYQLATRQQRQWLAMAAKEQQLTSTIEGGKDFKMNLTAVLDGYSGIEHWVDYSPLYRDVTQLLAASGTTMSAHISGSLEYSFHQYSIHDDPKLRRFMPHAEIDMQPFRARSNANDAPFTLSSQAEDAAKIIASGGSVALGSHADFPALGVHWQLWIMQSGGMPEYEALRAATLMSARAIGLERQLGSLEPGKLADLLVLDASPLLDIRNTNLIRHVMKNGRLYEADTLDEIWPRRQEYVPQ